MALTPALSRKRERVQDKPVTQLRGAAQDHSLSLLRERAGVRVQEQPHGR